MTGATSNITTQCTFRDGRDYVLSLNTTETPNTLSFWISDKITGEEWTGCYDENAIEVLTKRTGCYKSFQIFLSMIKCAMLKKSESVILDLYTLEDLTAMSVQRQRMGSALGMGSLLPASSMNIQMHNGDMVAPSSPRFHPGRGSRHVKPNKSDDREANGNTSDLNSSNGKSTASLLSKRKYLIVTYIGEFDKVHYPLPLNYSCPPDLSVMQNNIVKLKAEVTSLRSANKELAQEIETLRSCTATTCTSGTGGGDRDGRILQSQSSHSKTSHESRVSLVSCYCSKSRLNTSESAEVENVFVSKRDIGTSGMDFNDNDGHDRNPKAGDEVEDHHNGNSISTAITAESNSNSCGKCSGLIETLQKRIEELQGTLEKEKDQHLQSMENVENENHFLRHKIQAAEKYEMELWSQIQSLKEKLAHAELELEKGRRVLQNSRSNQCRQSRHDLFYGNQSQFISLQSRNTPPIPFKAKRVGGVTTIPVPVSPETRNKRNGINGDSPSRSRYEKRSASERSRSKSNSNSSTASNRTYDAHEIEGHIRRQIQRARSLNERGRGRSSSNNSLEMMRTRTNRRIATPSPPPRRFDPTAYVNEKKIKQSRIANLRLKKIKARFSLDASRSKSNTRARTLPQLSTTQENQKGNRGSSPSPVRHDHDRNHDGDDEGGENDRPQRCISAGRPNLSKASAKKIAKYILWH